MIKLVEWIATFVTLAGAVLTARDIDPLNIYVLNAGSALWFFWGMIGRHYSIAIVNLGMLLIYIYGIIQRNPNLLDESIIKALI